MMKSVSYNLVSIVSLTIAVFLWASSFVALKYAFQTYNPHMVIFGRMAIGFILFSFFIPKIKGFTYKKGDYRIILLMTFFEPCLYFIFEAKAISLTTASQAGMITSMMPVLVAIAAFFILKERISKLTWIGFIFAVIGACWLSAISESSDYAPNPALGNFFEFMAMICGAGYTVILKKLTNRYPSFLLTGLQALSGCVFFFIILMFSDSAIPETFEAGPTLAVVYLGTFVTLGAYGLFNFGVSRTSASKASAFINLIPVFSLFLGQLLLGESFTFLQYAASGLVLFGVFISQDHSLFMKRRSDDNRMIELDKQPADALLLKQANEMK